ncbi:unnamed protein product [Symbiodinium microadriaticum]|nr:unnamed protein product [Symbiodinium microadriaticum]
MVLHRFAKADYKRRAKILVKARFAERDYGVISQARPFWTLSQFEAKNANMPRSPEHVVLSLLPASLALTHINHGQGTANFAASAVALSTIEEHVDVSVFETQTKQGVKAYEARHTHLADLSRRRWRRTVRSRAEGEGK